MNRLWPMATAIFGVATLVILVGFGMLPDVRAAYPNGDFTAALNAFQRATTSADLNAVFGSPPDPARLQAMTAGNTLDLYGFIPAYALFLIAATIMVAGRLKTPLAFVAITLGMVGAAADVVETARQLRMTADWTHADALLPIAPWRLAKYFGLAGNALGIAAICLAGERKRWILGALGVLPVLGVSADALHLLPAPIFMTGVFGAFWLALLFLAIREVVRAKDASA